MGVYVILLGFTILYVNSVLSRDSLSVSQESKKKEVVEIKPVDVTLIVEPTSSSQTYSMRKNNTDSVLDLLNSLRKTTDFRYQKTGYLDRNEIDYVNDMYPPESYKWKIFYKDKDITQIFQNTYLEDNGIYYLKLIKE